MNRHPYPAQKPSGVEWLGEIPAHWEVKRLKHVTRCLDGKRVPLNSEQRGEKQGDIPYWGANGVLDHLDEFLFDEPLVLLGEDGAPFFDRLKDVAFYVNEKVWVNNHAHVLRPVGIEPVFLAHTLNMVEYRSFIDGTTRDKLTQDDMGQITIQTPPVDEQRAIAAYLDRETSRIDALIEKKQRQIELLQEKRIALISHAVTKGLNPNVKMKDSGIEWLGEIPAHWDVLAIKRITSVPITDGPHETPELLDEGIPFISAEAIKNDRIDFAKRRGFISPEEHARFSKKYKPKRGDIYLIKSGATTGNVAFVDTDEEFNIWSPLAAIRPYHKMATTLFVFYFMKSRNFFQSVELGWSYGTQQNIGMSVIENLPVVRPPLSEQRAIAAFLDRETARIDALVEKVEKSIALLREYRTSLISAAVTGKIDVRKEAA